MCSGGVKLFWNQNLAWRYLALHLPALTRLQMVGT
jgi:hypothetical protein